MQGMTTAVAVVCSLAQLHIQHGASAGPPQHVLDYHISNSAIACCAVIRNIEEGLLSYAGAPAPLNEVQNLDDDVTDLVLPMGEEYAADIFDLQSDFKVRVWGAVRILQKKLSRVPGFHTCICLPRSCCRTPVTV